MDDIQKKKLLYRANYRGFREADILLGGFLKENINKLSSEELLQFEALLSARDHDIYAWISGASSAPPEHDTPLLKKLRQYRPNF